MAWVAPQAQIERALADHPAVTAGVLRVTRSLHTAATALALSRAVDTGEYVQGIRIVNLPGPDMAVVATADHSWFVEVGTGVHGPLGRRVRAENGHPFVFFVDNGTRKIVTWEHEGRRPAHVMRDAAIRVASVPGITWNPADPGHL